MNRIVPSINIKASRVPIATAQMLNPIRLIMVSIESFLLANDDGERFAAISPESTVESVDSVIFLQSMAKSLGDGAD